MKKKELKVLLIDKGRNIYNRKCPILEKKIEKCPVDKKGRIGCKPGCSMTTGFGGATTQTTNNFGAIGGSFNGGFPMGGGFPTN